VAIAVFAATLAAAFVASAWHLEVYGVSRTREDRVAHEVGRMRGVEAEAIVLADSVTASPAYVPRPAPGVYMFLTNGYLRLAGQYLLFHRFLEHNRTKRMYLFVVPAEFFSDIPDDAGDGLGRYLYVDSVFRRADERRILDQAHAHPKREIEARFDLWLKTWYPDHNPRPFSLDMATVAPSTRPPDPDPAPRGRAVLTAQSRYVLERFREDCRAHHVECTFVQAPTHPDAPRLDMADLGRRYPGLRFVDMHDYVHYPAASFPDGMHMDRATGNRYLSAIQAYVAPLFASESAPWDGSRASFDHPETLSTFAADSWHATEPWGTWSSEATLAMRFRVSRELKGGALAIAWRALPAPSGSVPVSFRLDGSELAQATSTDAGTRETVLRLGERALAPSRVHTLEIRMPKAVNLQALGVSADARDLGPGVASIAYCRSEDCRPE
jgi:hypothetical protein